MYALHVWPAGSDPNPPGVGQVSRRLMLDLVQTLSASVVLQAPTLGRFSSGQAPCGTLLQRLSTQRRESSASPLSPGRLPLPTCATKMPCSSRCVSWQSLLNLHQALLLAACGHISRGKLPGFRYRQGVARLFRSDVATVLCSSCCACSTSKRLFCRELPGKHDHCHLTGSLARLA